MKQILWNFWLNLSLKKKKKKKGFQIWQIKGERLDIDDQINQKLFKNI